MARFGSEREMLEFFDEQYLRSRSRVMLAIESEVQGTDYGATSWTTPAQADSMAGRLGLAPGVRLLDVGAGTGWPGLYMAARTGCSVTLADVPINGLRLALERARLDDVSASGVAADGSSLSLRERSFDAVSHSDVLCCLSAKRATLDECRRVLTDDGTLAFTVILTPESVAVPDDVGPEYVASGTPYATLLQEVGFTSVETIDLSAELRLRASVSVASTERHMRGLAELLGKDEACQLLQRRQRSQVAIEQGLLLRHLYVAKS